tara:strand:+ start:325 stop:1416 length:1092 start_codon:yes stop_codon:yes gene_type:complete
MRLWNKSKVKIKNLPLEPFFELSHDFLCIAGYNGYFKKVNPAFQSLLGYSHKELLSRPISEFIYQEDKETTAKFRESLLKNIPLLNFENRYSTKEGEIVWLSWTSVAIPGEKLVYAIAKNITHLKMIDQERNLLLTELTKINSDLKQITYTNSHNLRSPVSNLLSIFELLDTAKIKDKETLDLLELFRLSAESLKDTLNDYVDTLIARDRQNVSVTNISLKESLDVTQQSISSLIRNAQATFHIDFSELEEVSFNKNYLESIFLNLITNSIKYARPDLQPRITISSKKENGCSQIIYNDNGLGFDMQKVKDKIFGLHQKFHNHIDSKGIGLYLVYNHIRSLGGNIHVESAPNKGTTFVISLRP